MIQLDRHDTLKAMPEARSAIPADLRRRVLVEAGHRCAIHTCRHPTTDLHHIVPWEKCKAHTYENLIPLCPNCHRRADSGQIDRQALYMYKSRLRSAVVDVSETPVSEPTVTPVGWATASVRESEDASGMTVDVEHPVFTYADLVPLNTLEQAWVTEELMRYRRLRFRDEGPPYGMVPYFEPASDEPPQHDFSATYEVLLLSPHAVSLRYSVREYHTGATHSLYYVRTVTAQRDPLIVLTLDTLFRPDVDFAERISALATAQLLGQGLDEEMVREGAGPDASNFQTFNVTKEGLLLTFSEYQVASFADGPQYATIPWRSLRDCVNRDCRVFEDLPMSIGA
ncbi:DUF3298 domain-containing protein [Luteitalea sp.]